VESLTIKAVTLPKLFVLVGQVVVPDEGHELVTILGSCVSVCLWDRKTRKGGINHYLLPETVNNAKSLHGGIAATRMLIQSMAGLSSGRKNLEAQIFGGANRFFKSESFLNVGRQNVTAALVALDEAGINVVHQDTGGETGRKIYFNTETGRVVVNRINYTLPTSITPA